MNTDFETDDLDGFIQNMAKNTGFETDNLDGFIQDMAKRLGIVALR